MQKQVIFVVSPGRCGTAYLAKLFEACQATIAFHEPEPTCIGNSFRLYKNQGNSSLLEQVSRQKVNLIENYLTEYDCYVETSNMFSKSFGHFVVPSILDRGYKVNVIFLRRDISEIASSSLRIRCIPPSGIGRNWLITPLSQSPVIQPPAFFFFLRKAGIGKLEYRLIVRLYYLAKSLGLYRWKIFSFSPRLCFDSYWLSLLKWQAEEVYRLGESIVKTNPRMRAFDITLNDLNELSIVCTFFRELGLSPDIDSLRKDVGQPLNQKLA
ncbi:hypothetical protein [Synechococcus sp. WH 8016]|uniref:hypothetical protein n=1 Tax=Synechococcus sp. WH 8016 TaxID=166318 RepID=UPI00022D9E91|nr:hypothetical protein [Synechococcus sp. WH 8016]EHA62385.1 hypothetical protein Syn8016DRAFT_1680 [Synechococcus sp. WH 8016]